MHPLLTFLVWLTLVAACALPPPAMLARSFERQEWIGIVAAALCWVVVMFRIDLRRQRQSPGAARSLRYAAVIYAVVQGLAGVVLPREAVLVAYTPAVVVASRVLIVPFDAEDLAAAFILTLFGGAQVFLSVLLIARGLSRLGARRK